METFSQDWKECSFPEWFETFGERTLKSKVIPLSKDFIDFLRDDAFIVPESVVPKFKDTEELDESAVHVGNEEKYVNVLFLFFNEFHCVRINSQDFAKSKRLLTKPLSHLMDLVS